MSVINKRSNLEDTWLQGRLQYNRLKDNPLIAETIAYHENGRLRFKYPVYDSKFHGTGRIWFDNGVLQCEENFIDNIQHGLKREWYLSGQLYKESLYEKGLLHGLMKVWHPNGVQKYQYNFVRDVVEGLQLEWYSNCQLKCECHIVQRRRHGIFKYWHPDGRLQKKEIYIRDVRITGKIQKLIDSRELTADHILKMGNTAVRRVCLEELGYGRFLSQVPHEIIQKEDDYELVKINWHKREEPICLVKVKCPSTGAFYTLRVPPTMVTIKEAVAWTFGMTGDKYLPEEEA